MQYIQQRQEGANGHLLTSCNSSPKFVLGNLFAHALYLGTGNQELLLFKGYPWGFEELEVHTSFFFTS